MHFKNCCIQQKYEVLLYTLRCSPKISSVFSPALTEKLITILSIKVVVLDQKFRLDVVNMVTLSIPGIKL